MPASIRVPFLFTMIVMSSALWAPAAPQVKYTNEPISPREEPKPEKYPPPPPVDPEEVKRIQSDLFGLLEKEQAFQGVGTQLISDPGVTTYRIYVNMRLPWPKLLEDFLADPARFLNLPRAAVTRTADAASADETSCVGRWCFKPVRMEPLRTFAARMGGSTSTRAGCFEGTVGVHVVDNTSGATGYVTNNHVAGAEGPLLCPNAGRARQVAPGMKITMCQAGPTAGRLQRRAEIEFAPDDNVVDAAFVKAGNVRCDGCGIHPNGEWYTRTSLAGPSAASLQLLKCGVGSDPTKSGVGSLTTNGRVVSNDVSLKLIFLPCGLTAKFIQQIEIEGEHFAQSGDSGAWVFDPHGKAVGMIFAGDEDRRTFVNPADAVLSKLDVSIVRCH